MCKCKVVQNEVSTHGGLRHYVPEIVYCSIHSAAPKLLEACKEAREFQRLLGADQDERLTKKLDTVIYKATHKSNASQSNT